MNQPQKKEKNPYVLLLFYVQTPSYQTKDKQILRETPNITDVDPLLRIIIKTVIILIVSTSLGITFYEYHAKTSNLFSPPVRSSQEENPPTGLWIEKIEPFELDALVLSRKTYRDQNADIAPIDLALAWGKLTDPDLAKLLIVQQGNRFFYWTLPPNQPLSAGDIISHASNMHMVSTSNDQTNSLLQIKRGDRVKFKGFLVNIHKNGQTWKTSLSRTDTGTGACEVFLTTYIEILDRNLLP